MGVCYINAEEREVEAFEAWEGGVGERAATMEGRRRSKRRRRTVMGEEGEIEISSTFFIVEPRVERSEADANRGRRGSSNVCCEALRSGEELDMPKLFLGSKREREEITDSSSDDGDREAGFDLEPTAERDSHRRSPADAMPTEAELEGFFAAAESELRRRFAERYNFDVVNDAPFAGRFEWIRLAHGNE
ncbi:cyclin-dependent kinase inhibitor 1-like [Curcuma longa]|uniref:cyclin-dependent kinase inhibitor 1-like n=1 Tax=Curcuma longa TaxID=136217 RepID=UPI003D9E8D41